MRLIVVDASALIDSLVGPAERARRTRARLDAIDTFLAPAMIQAEVASALRRMVLRGRVGEARGRLALVEACRLPLVTFPFQPFAMRVWSLRDRVSTYDAWYVALAEAARLPLLTADARLARAAPESCEVELTR